MLGKPLLHPLDPHIVAVATDAPARLPTRLPAFGLNDVGAIATFVAERAAWPVTD
jgi:molybdopterin-guanine dinucleotide biosynthesis protein B